MTRTLAATPSPEPYQRIATVLHQRAHALASTTTATLRAPLVGMATSAGKAHRR